MQARRTVPNRHVHLAWALAIFGAAALGMVPLSLLNLGPVEVPSLGGGSTARHEPRIAYFEFASAADTLWLADATDPSRRQKALVVPHADDFGVVPSLAPDGRRFVYTSLPPGLKAPSPDTPAGLWLFTAGESQPRLLADGVDLLVRPAWSRGSDAIVFRRSSLPSQSTPGHYDLVRLDLAIGEQRTLVSSDGAALFPIAYSADERLFYYVRIDGDGSQLAAAAGDGTGLEVARLASGLTRDWSLSPDGTRLAYLVMSFEDGRISSRAAVLDLATGSIAAAGLPDVDAFNPVWTADGRLVLGSPAVPGGRERIGPAQLTSGFDVPLAFSPASDGLVVRSFDGVSAVSPGRPTLTLVDRGGVRHAVASGEVTFVGWMLR
jgi:Tol biopolymer transport system component